MPKTLILNYKNPEDWIEKITQFFGEPVYKKLDSKQELATYYVKCEGNTHIIVTICRVPTGKLPYFELTIQTFRDEYESSFSIPDIKNILVSEDKVQFSSEAELDFISKNHSRITIKANGSVSIIHNT